ncbi:MAG: hypothetical protein KME38_28830 [Spirirestis rafaelensis WJT71-NPBG6]|nr:hypothetical protein [Spirirestis rafaelensis WJT71-NPBG6]
MTCLWDVKTDTPKVEAIIKSGLLDWVKLDDLETEYSSESEGGQQFLRKALASKKQLKTALGITVKDDSSPIKLAIRLLDRLGLKLAYSKKNDGVKYYKLDEELVNDPDRQAVFDALNLKWQKEVAKMAETHYLTAKIYGTGENNFLYKNEAQSREFKPEELAENHVVQDTTEEWNKPEEIQNIAEMLNACESVEMLAELRQCDIPTWVLKAASKRLETGKRQEIKAWVVKLNSVA